MDELSRYSLDDLAKETGLSPRTIRHYIAQDLLPGAEALGRNAWYSEDHLHRLKCIQVLRNLTGMALADLRPLLNSLTEEQVRDIATGREKVMALPVGQSPSTRGTTYTGTHTRRPGPGRTARVEVHEEASDDALAYIRRLRAGSREEATRLAGLVRSVEGLTGPNVPRRSRHDYWVTVEITPDIEIRARGLNDEDLGELERLADLLRHLLLKGVEK